MKYWLFYIFSVLFVAAVLFRPPKNTPVVEVAAGQVLYSVNVATSQTVVTGFKIPVVTSADHRNVAQYSPPPAPPLSPDVLRAAKSAGASSGQPAAGPKEPRRPSVAVSPQKLSRREIETAELLNPYIIENIIKASDKTYYFTEKSLERGRVTVELLSMTPRKNDYLLKFRITNASKEHFIPQAFAVKHGDDWVDVELFFKYMLQAGESQVGYLRVKAESSQENARMFQLNESGGGYRKYSIFY